MLLTDLLKLFANNFNINEERFLSIVESNNIKISQRLLSEIKAQKKLNTNTSTGTNRDTDTDTDTDINTDTNADTNGDIAINNNDANLEINSKKETPGRGRGRPRKTREIKEEESVLVEVEVITLGTNEFYKTNENVLLNKNLEIEGILKNGKVVKREKW